MRTHGPAWESREPWRLYCRNTSLSFHCSPDASSGTPIPKFAPLFTTPARYLVLGGMAWEETLAESCSSWWQVHVFQDAMNFRKSGLFEIDIIHLSMPVWDYKVETVLKDIWNYQARVQWHFTIWKPT